MPREILMDRLLELRAAARRIDILHAQQKESARHLSRHLEVGQRGKRVTKMQIAVGDGAKRKTGVSWVDDRAPTGQGNDDRCHHARQKTKSREVPMTTHITTDADLDAGIAALDRRGP